MHKLKALMTLQWLAKGKNPTTKKPLPDNSIYRHPEVTMALLIAIQALETQVAQEQQALSEDPQAIEMAIVRQQATDEKSWDVAATMRAIGIPEQNIIAHPVEITRPKQKANAPLNAGKSWNREEDEALIQAFDGGAAIKELAEKHQRTAGSITSRLMRHGKMTLNLESRTPDMPSEL